MLPSPAVTVVRARLSPAATPPQLCARARCWSGDRHNHPDGHLWRRRRPPPCPSPSWCKSNPWVSSQHCQQQHETTTAHLRSSVPRSWPASTPPSGATSTPGRGIHVEVTALPPHHRSDWRHGAPPPHLTCDWGNPPPPRHMRFARLQVRHGRSRRGVLEI
jgi:hypothetical protein